VIVAGIDPGKTGALAILQLDNSVLFLDVPQIKLKGKTVPAWQAWANDWRFALDFAGVDRIVIESVSARPRQGVTSMFNFGRTLGFAHCLGIATAGASIHLVTPVVWKAKFGLLNSDKGASREKMTNLLPKAASSVSRAKDDGRAEAALLAYYGRQYL
jgi:crossover junction endodeoxyribonuclease RuvC